MHKEGAQERACEPQGERQADAEACGKMGGMLHTSGDHQHLDVRLHRHTGHGVGSGTAPHAWVFNWGEAVGQPA